ncbi:MAG TPA: hypothetical protein VGE02_12685 [Gemmatimonadales bacterium]
MGGAEFDLDRVCDALGVEFGMEIPSAHRAGLRTPGSMIEYLAEHLPPTSESLDAEERRDYVSGVMCEVLARETGTALFDEDAPWPGIR